MRLIEYLIFVNVLLIEIASEDACHQAWNGGGTGAWYRLDTSCEYALIATELISTLPTIVVPSNLTSFDDGFYVSLGIYNRFNGYSLDVGLTYDYGKKKWYSYANDRLGWKVGKISIDSKIDSSIRINFFVNETTLHYLIRTVDQSKILGEDIYFSSQLDPFLNLTKNSSSIGFYRFDSIAQSKETLHSGSEMLHSKISEWTFQLQSGELIDADEHSIASNVSGYRPGPCCTTDEIKTITVHQQIQWNQSDISIEYPLEKK